MKELTLLGYKAKDRVTGFEGIIESICFDLYGCIQCVLRGPVNDKGEIPQGQWYDIKRLGITSDQRVMDAPDFASVPGGTIKPAGQSHPAR